MVYTGHKKGLKRCKQSRVNYKEIDGLQVKKSTVNHVNDKFLKVYILSFQKTQ